MGASAGLAKYNGNRPVASGQTGTGKGKETGTGRDGNNNDAPLASGANGAINKDGSKSGLTSVGARGYLRSQNHFPSIFRIPPVAVQDPIVSHVNPMSIQDLTVRTQLVPP